MYIFSILNLFDLHDMEEIINVNAHNAQENFPLTTLDAIAFIILPKKYFIDK